MAPVITIISDNSTLIEPNPIQLKCTALGVPRPILSWSLQDKVILTTARIGGDTIPRDSVFHVDEYGNGFNIKLNISGIYAKPTNRYGTVKYSERQVSLELMVPNSTKKMAGNYKCLAINAIGATRKSSYINVYCKYAVGSR